MMYNNYNNPKVRDNIDPTALDLHGFLPETDHRSIIVIIRLSQMKLGYYIKIGKLKDMRDSLKILSHTSDRGNTVDSEIYSR